MCHINVLVVVPGRQNSLVIRGTSWDFQHADYTISFTYSLQGNARGSCSGRVFFVRVYECLSVRIQVYV